MKNFKYKKMMEEYGKESKESLIQIIMALQEIECADRAFANQCKASISFQNADEFFKEGITKINDDSRFEKTLNKIKDVTGNVAVEEEDIESLKTMLYNAIIAMFYAGNYKYMDDKEFVNGVSQTIGMSKEFYMQLIKGKINIF